MKVYEKLNIEIPGTNTHYFNLSEFSKNNSEDALYLGYTFLEQKTPYEYLKKHKRNIYLNVTSPTEFCGPTPKPWETPFDEVWSICPYSNQWHNIMLGQNKYRNIFYPINKRDFPPITDKEYDVIYHGGLHGEKYVNMLMTMKKFNYRYASQTQGINSLTADNLVHATNLNLTNKEKFELISKCKISICYNTFEVRNERDRQHIKSREGWEKNEAWKHIDDLGIIPQFKSRCNEAAASRTLNLVKRDPWNIIETYYTPGDDFVYFDSNDELKDQIDKILNNWSSYEKIIKNAYNKALRYTTENLMEIIDGGAEWKPENVVRVEKVI